MRSRRPALALPVLALPALGLLAACTQGPAVVTALDVGTAAVAIAKDGRTGTLGVADGARPIGAWTRIAVAAKTACALEPDGRPDCWRIGDDTLLTSVPAGPFEAFDVADGAAVFVFADGTLGHWPQRTEGLPTDGPWRDVAAVGATEVGHPGLCGVDDGGGLWCGEADAAAPGGPWAEVDRTPGSLCARSEAGPITCFTVTDGAWSETGTLDGDFTALSTGTAGGVCGLARDGGIACDGFGADDPGWADLAPAGVGFDAVALSSDAAWGCALSAGEPVCFGAPTARPAGDWSW